MDKSHFEYSPSPLFTPCLSLGTGVLWRRLLPAGFSPRLSCGRIWGMAGRQEDKEAEMMTLMKSLRGGVVHRGLGYRQALIPGYWRDVGGRFEREKFIEQEAQNNHGV